MLLLSGIAFKVFIFYVHCWYIKNFFCITTLYAGTLLNLVINSNDLCFLRIFYVQNYAICKQKSYFFLILMLSDYFSSLTLLARSFCRILNTISDSR